MTTGRNPHDHCIRNREEIARSQRCFCFYCTLVFPATDVVSWVREASGHDTALCPNCGIDSVIGDASGFAPDEGLIRGMREIWFGDS